MNRRNHQLASERTRPRLTNPLGPVARVALAFACLGLLATTTTASTAAATTVRGPTPFMFQVDSIATRVVVGTVISTSVVTGPHADLWTLYEIEADRTERGKHQPSVIVAAPGGTDPETGNWAVATHAARLTELDVVRIALLDAPADLARTLTGAASRADTNVHLVALGEYGVQLLERVDDRFLVNSPILKWDFSSAVPYRTNPAIDSQLLPNATAIVQRSFQAMQDDAASDIRWTYSGTSGATGSGGFNDFSGPFDNHVYPAPAGGFTGYAQVVGTTNGATGFRIVIEPNVTFAGISLPWVDGVAPAGANALNLQTVIMHELGHVIGLNHPGTAGNVMSSPQVPGADPAAYSADDSAGFGFLYPAQNPSGGGVGTCENPGPDAIVGTSGNDFLPGTPGNDLIAGLGGNDIIAGGGGNDTICGGPGNDTIFGQGGNDNIRGDGGNDKLRGGDGDDTVSGNDGVDDLNGGRGNDVVSGGAGNDAKVRGGTGNDQVDGGPGDDVLIAGNGGQDFVSGGTGNDALISGGPRPDVLRGGTGNDLLRGLGGADELYGDGGNDELFGGPQPDRILDGGSGFDVCNGGAELTAPGAASNCESLSNIG